jgi:hypothetical protein
LFMALPAKRYDIVFASPRSEQIMATSPSRRGRKVNRWEVTVFIALNIYILEHNGKTSMLPYMLSQLQIQETKHQPAATGFICTH